ncbi:zinc dependent phospholipase C family protein [Pseudalkalibacillus berkeleyi]|uniref:Zinc dependent phospholipase C family protein n=1 Tax=Pseudalkalibacillus berkeleyi TaxID=1069813 RepID=A0ABS9GWZ4_9BACL|nr:zinc dependent phospholipase C family protein [Pseudalkalibacillus berkeleyi]MCF6136139.1 zinc dependent phospholipase C family protein [Pseudalkalibacillus berkeleyi]
MPNVWTHIYFGERLLEKTRIFTLTDETRPYFNFGTQGPDPFFYHNFWPWKSSYVTEVGDRIHHENCGDFLMKLIEYTKQHTHDDKLVAFTTGFLTHHILDRNAHPYINYRSGTEGNRHQKLEIIIDTLLMKREKGIETWNTPVNKQLAIGKTLHKPIEKMLEETIVTTFPDLHEKMPEGYINQSYRHMQTALRVLFDPLGWKNKLLKDRVDPFSYQKEIAEADYLNEQQTPWYHPAQPDEKHDETFMDLIEQAEKEGIDILNLLKSYWFDNNEGARELLKENIGNFCYDTGKELSLRLENKHFDPIL